MTENEQFLIKNDENTIYFSYHDIEPDYLITTFDPLDDKISKLELRNHKGDDDYICETARCSTYAKEHLDKLNTTDLTAKNKNLIHKLYKEGHTSPIEFAVYDFYIKAPLFVVTQMLRHRTGKFSQASERYRPIANNEFYVPKRERLQGQAKSRVNCSNGIPVSDEIATDFYTAMAELNAYSVEIKKRFEGEIANELLRLVTPSSMYVDIFISFDLNNLLKFIRLRLSPYAQFEIRQYAQTMLNTIQIMNPLIYEAYQSYKHEVTEIEFEHSCNKDA